MRIAVCDDNAQDIERIKRYTIRMIEYAVDYVFYKTGRISSNLYEGRTETGYVYLGY